MKTVKCLICGLEMKDRINGSHLKRSHDIDLNQYKEMFPDADLGEYRTNPFECKACGEVISGVSETVWKHIYYKHGFNDIHEYNHAYNKTKCLKGCGKDADYSYSHSVYLKFCKECYILELKQNYKNLKKQGGESLIFKNLNKPKKQKIYKDGKCRCGCGNFLKDNNIEKK